MSKVQPDTTGNTALFDNLTKQAQMDAKAEESSEIEEQKEEVTEKPKRRSGRKIKTEQKVFVSVRLIPKLKKRLDKYADAQDMTINAVVKRAITKMLESEGF